MHPIASLSNLYIYTAAAISAILEVHKEHEKGNE